MAYDSTSFSKPQVDEVGLLILAGRQRMADAPCLWKETDDSDTGGSCLLIALQLDYGDVRTPVQKAALFRVARQIGYRANRVMQAQDRIVAFNDAPDTTHSEVLDLLDRAAGAK
jgi:hypothetical protein